MKLTIDSICLISSIIDKLNIDDKFINDMIEMGKATKGKDEKYQEKLKAQIGVKIVLKISSKLHDTRNDLVRFIASYKDITEEEAAKYDIVEIVKEFMNDEDFMSFLKRKAISE